MDRILNRIFDTSLYAGTVERGRARMIYNITVMAILLYSINAFFLTSNITNKTIFEDSFTNVGHAIIFYAFYVLALLSLWATRFKREWLASWSPVMMLYTVSLLSTRSHFLDPEDGIIMAIFVLISGLLNLTPGLIFSVFAAIATLLLSLITVGEPVLEDIAVYSLTLIGTGMVAGLFIRYAHLSRFEGESAAVSERLKLAELTAKITEYTLQRRGVSEALTGIIEQIRGSYPELYHVQVFMVDDAGLVARLTASTGEVGKMLMARQHSLGVGSLSVIGQVTLHGKHIIVRAKERDAVHHRNELLPETVVEAAFPMNVGNRTIGALDVQSKQQLAFDESDLSTFQSLANSIALAIDNVRQFENAEERVQENQRLVEQLRGALREIERFNERLTGRAWSEYIHQQPEDIAMNVDFAANTTQDTAKWTDTLAEAARFDQVVQDNLDGKQIIAIPLRVRGQVIGAMEFELDGQGDFPAENLELVQEVSERFGLAAENTRLLEESQRIAQREALVNEISARLQASHNVETTLAEAARSLGGVLKADRVAIRLGAPVERDRQDGQKEE